MGIIYLQSAQTYIRSEPDSETDPPIANNPKIKELPKTINSSAAGAIYIHQDRGRWRMYRVRFWLLR